MTAQSWEPPPGHCGRPRNIGKSFFNIEKWPIPALFPAFGLNFACFGILGRLRVSFWHRCNIGASVLASRLVRSLAPPNTTPIVLKSPAPNPLSRWTFHHPQAVGLRITAFEINFVGNHHPPITGFLVWRADADDFQTAHDAFDFFGEDVAELFALRRIRRPEFGNGVPIAILERGEEIPGGLPGFGGLL